MRIYISGPMTGYEDLNWLAFKDAQITLENMGHEVFNPGNHRQGTTRRQALETDLAWICRKAGGMVMLWDWGQSRGAVAEYATANALEIPVWYQVALGSKKFICYDRFNAKGEALCLGRAA